MPVAIGPPDAGLAGLVIPLSSRAETKSAAALPPEGSSAAAL